MGHFNWWVAEAWDEGPIILFAWVVWVIGSIVLHELAHGWAAIRCGDRTPIETGHMTWNPLVHMGQASLILFALIGIAWGQMPVNPSRFRGRYDDAIVSVAGPVMNVSLFAVAITGAVASAFAAVLVGEEMASKLFMFFFTGAWLNMALALFNLMPVPPLDGSHILGNIVPGFRKLWEGNNAQVLGLVAFAGLFFFGGRYIFGGAMHVTTWVLTGVLSAMTGAEPPP